MSEDGTASEPSPKPGEKKLGAENPLTQLRSLLSRAARSSVELTEEHILLILAVRRGREDVFGRDLFSDPAWDVLLELYAAKLADRRATASELAAAIDAPQSTTARWIAALADRGLVAPEREPREPGRLWISLTSEGAARMKRLADQWGSAFTSI